MRLNHRKAEAEADQSQAVHHLLAKDFIAYSANRYLDRGTTILPLKMMFLLITIVT